MKETGKRLKSQREAKQMSLSEVSVAIKITPRMLQAMEAAEMDLLPARTFLRGFVKTYSALLKMDVDEVLRLFNEEMDALEAPPPSEHPETDMPPPPASTHKSSEDLISDRPSAAKKAAWVLGILALVALIWLVQQVVEKYKREGVVEELPPSLSRIDDHSNADPAPALNPAPAPVEPSPTAEAAPTESNNAASAPAPTAEQVQTPEPAPTAEQVQAPEPVAAPAPAPTPATVQEIIIEALDKVEISIRDSGGDSAKIKLLPDQVHTIKAKGTVTLEISDGGAINLIYNGRDRGVPGDLGQPKTVKLP